MTKTSIAALINQAGILRLSNGVTTVFYGLKIHDGRFYYYTAKGIREHLILRNQDQHSLHKEETIYSSGCIASIPCDNIQELVCLNRSISKAA